MFYIQAECRQTGRLIGKPRTARTQRMAQAIKAQLRLIYPNVYTVDVCCWEVEEPREAPAGLLFDVVDARDWLSVEA